MTAICLGLSVLKKKTYDITTGHWVNSLCPSYAIWHHKTWSSLVQVVACCLMSRHIEAKAKWIPFCKMTFSNLISWMKICILIKISLKYVHKVPINNTSALVPRMAWHRTGDKPLKNHGLDNWHIYSPPSHHEFNLKWSWSLMLWD